MCIIINSILPYAYFYKFHSILSQYPGPAAYNPMDPVILPSKVVFPLVQVNAN